MNKKTAWLVCLLITMVVICGILVFSVLNRTATSSEPSLSFRKFTSGEGNFSILMPGEPKKKKIGLKTKHGAVDEVHFFYEQKMNPFKDVTFAVAYLDVPEDIVNNQPLEQRLNNAKRGMFNLRKGKLISEKAIMIDGQPGWEIRFSANLSGFIASQNIIRLFEINHRFYKTMYMECRRFHYSDKINNNLAYEFLDSFKRLTSA